MKNKFYFKMLTLALLITALSTSVFASVGFTVYLQNSSFAALAGGQLEYRLGGGSGWIVASETGIGEWDLTAETAGYTQVGLRMTWNHQELKVSNVPTNVPYTFQTELVAIEFRTANGSLGIDGGFVDYTSDGWWPIGFTGIDDQPDGIITFEMLPTVYTFRMTYDGQRCLIHTHNIANDGPVVTFQMIKLMVQLNNSAGERGLDGGVVSYQNYDGWYYFGTTGYTNIWGPEDDLPITPDGETGRVRKQLLPGEYNIRMEYPGYYKEVQYDLDLTNPTNSVIFNINDFTLKSSSAFGNNETNLVSYPNPFSSNTTVSFTLEESQNVVISVYDMNGKMVKEIVNSTMEEGIHKISVNTEEMTKGYYILKLNTSNQVSHMNIVKM